MEINGKNYNIEDIVEKVNIDNNIPKKRKNGLVLRESHIEILKKYHIEYENFTTLSSLIMEIENVITEIDDCEELEDLSLELSEINYYNYTNK